MEKLAMTPKAQAAPPKWKVVPQFGRAPKLELAFERDGRIYAYLVPADERRQECFDAMKEIGEIFSRKAKGKP